MWIRTCKNAAINLDLVAMLMIRTVKRNDDCPDLCQLVAYGPGSDPDSYIVFEDIREECEAELEWIMAALQATQR
jgi:hypothetical protein